MEKEVKKEKNKKALPVVYYSTQPRRSLASVLSKHSAKPPCHRSKTPPKLLSHWLSPPQPDKTLLSLPHSITHRTARAPPLLLPPAAETRSQSASGPEPLPSSQSAAAELRCLPLPPPLLLEPRPPVPGSPPAAVARAEAPALPWRRSPPVASARSPSPTSRRWIRARAGLLSPDLSPSCGGPSPPSGGVAT